MANPPKKKGTAAETELVRLLGRGAERMPSGWPFDVRVYGADGDVHEVLATRPDRGQWLVTMRLADLLCMWDQAQYPPDLHIEVKRYRRFALHTIFENKFGRKPSYRAEQLKGRDDV